MKEYTKKYTYSDQELKKQIRHKLFWHGSLDAAMLSYHLNILLSVDEKRDNQFFDFLEELVKEGKIKRHHITKENPRLKDTQYAQDKYVCWVYRL